MSLSAHSFPLFFFSLGDVNAQLTTQTHYASLYCSCFSAAYVNKHTLGESRQNHHVVCLRSARKTDETTEAKNSRSGFAFCKVVGQVLYACADMYYRSGASNHEG